jgi:hypothetical protein
MSRRTCTPWTPDEEALLRRHYPTLGSSGMHAAGMLEHRSNKSIQMRAHHLGLRMLGEAYAGAQREKLLAYNAKKRLGRMIDPTPEEIVRRCAEIRETWADPPERFDGRPRTGTVRMRGGRA